MELERIGVQLVLCLFLDSNFSICFRGNRTFSCTQGMTNVRDDILFICLMTVELQAKLSKSRLFQLVINHIQGCQLFRNKQHFFTIAEAFRDDVCDRLAFSGSRRALQNEALSRLCHLNRFDLAGVCINHIM